MSSSSKLESEAVKFIIERTPYGLYKDIANGIRSMVKVDSNPSVQNIIKEYEEDHFKQVPLENDKLIISKVTKDKEGYYNDQSKKYKLMINPLSENFEKLERIGAPDPIQVKFDKALNSYKDKCYEKEYASINVFFVPEKEPNKWRVSLVISSHASLPNSKISGEWNSNYSVVNLSNDEWIVSGAVVIKSYFYEDCNFLFYKNKEIKEEKIAFSKETNEDQKISLVINKIEEIENKIQDEINGIYENFNYENIKPLRKRLSCKYYTINNNLPPLVTGKKMKWSEIQYSFDGN